MAPLKEGADHVTPSGLDQVEEKESTTYHVTFQALPSSLEPIARLRHLLKFALRALDLKCTDCRHVRRGCSHAWIRRSSQQSAEKK